jgi:hypothetical protein
MHEPTSLVFNTPPPNALGIHTVQVECMPNSACTLFVLFLCGQLLAQGGNAACFPDVFDCNAVLPERKDERQPRPHHYVAKLKFATFWAMGDGREAPRPPCQIDPVTHSYRAWARVSPTVRILFFKDPLQNYLSLRRKKHCQTCGGMRAKFALADHLFDRVYMRGELRAPRRGGPSAEGQYDAVLFAEDMAEPERLLGTLRELLGEGAVGTRPTGIHTLVRNKWRRNNYARMVRSNQELGYHWAGTVATGSANGRPFRYGGGNAGLGGTRGQFYSPVRRPHTRAEQALVSAMAPSMAAAWQGTWAAAVETPAVPRRNASRHATVARACDGCLDTRGCAVDLQLHTIQLYGLRTECACARGAALNQTIVLGEADSRLRDHLKPTLVHCPEHDGALLGLAGTYRLRASLECPWRSAGTEPAGGAASAGFGGGRADARRGCHALVVQASEQISAQFA